MIYPAEADRPYCLTAWQPIYDVRLRSICCARSTADFINKLKMVEEEADETIYWLEIMQESGLMTADQVKELIFETSELPAIIVTSIKTIRERSRAAQP
jgi:hypothetical protein